MREAKFALWKVLLTGALAGFVNGFFGAGGGMLVVPLLIVLVGLADKQAFSSAISIILPLTIVSLVIYAKNGALDIKAALPYLLGGAGGGVLAGLWFRKVSARVLHIDSLWRREAAAMVDFFLAVLAGLICGVLSGFGIGGGSLLMVWLTALLSMDQRTAQGINLLYFLPAAGCSLIFHVKNRQIVWKAVVPAAIAGCLTAIPGALLAGSVDTALLRRLFGGFLVLVGISEVFFKGKKTGSSG